MEKREVEIMAVKCFSCKFFDEQAMLNRYDGQMDKVYICLQSQYRTLKVGKIRPCSDYRRKE